MEGLCYVPPPFAPPLWLSSEPPNASDAMQQTDPNAASSSARAPRVLMVAGEASGDVHAAALLRALKARVPGLTAFGMGGAHLRAAGLEALYDASEISVMGLVEVLPKLFGILRVLKSLSREAALRRPDLAILVDVPDFNLRLAKRLKALGIPVVYYVSPMIWASRPWRARTIRRRVDTMLCILPFEEPWLKSRGIQARYVGNPVLDALPPPSEARDFRQRLGLDPCRRTLALVPGSRRSEIARVLPVMCAATQSLLTRHPDLQIAVPVAPTIDADQLRAFFARFGLSPALVEGRVCDVVGASDAAIVCSGTAALEAGLMLRPFVVVYRVQPLTALAFRLVRTVKHISLVNLLAGREIVPELFQRDCTAERVAREAAAFLEDEEKRSRVIRELGEVRSTLGEPGASRRAADAVIEVLDRLGRLPAGSRTIDAVLTEAPEKATPPADSAATRAGPS